MEMTYKDGMILRMMSRNRKYKEIKVFPHYFKGFLFNYISYVNEIVKIDQVSSL